ncbi:MAG: hypothetical protein V4454_17330 [Pseudomonadota bacterium]
MTRLRRWTFVLALIGASLLPSVAFSQSACTAMWGIVSAGGVARLGYFNGSAGTAQKFTTLSFTIAGTNNANALAGDPSTGLLYHFDRSGLTLNSANLNTMTTSTVGTIAPASPDGNGNILGAYIDASSNLIMLSASAAGTATYHVATVSKAGNTTNAVWRTVTYAIGGGLPSSGGSGDIYLSQSGQAYLVTNTTPVAAYPLNITITPGSPNGTITASTVGASVTFATGPGTVQGGSVDPNTGINYFAGVTANKIVYSFNPAVANSEVLVDATAATVESITDMGNCVLPPAKPTITKSFANTYEAGGTGNTTTTLTITFGNSNTVPIWLMQPFSDVFPTGMKVFNTVTFTSTCNTSVPSATITVGSTSMTWAAGGRIQAGGCSISFPVTATAALTPYVNTVAAGSLTTTSGTNTLPAQATLTVGTDFTLTKQVGTGTSGQLGSSATLGTLQTLQYVITISNSTTGGTGSVTFSDTLPVQITPVLSITAGYAGTAGGSCSTASAVVTGRTVVTGTVTNAQAGSTCTVTITAKGSSTVATFLNTATLVPIATTVDVDPTDNSGTATVTLTAANITISKTNGLAGTVQAGQTVVYTVTISNLGPSVAVPSFLKDPSVAGLSCTNAVACTAAGTGSSCPSAGSSTVAYLTAGGIQIDTFNAANTLTFAITCGVTATGLP